MNKDKFLVKDGDRAEWGVPEGYPWKEDARTISIEWDGNIEGKLSVMDMFYKVSDAILDNETIKNGIIYAQINNVSREFAIKDIWDDALITDEIVIPFEGISFVRADNVKNGRITFPEAGVYFAKSNNLYVTKFISDAGIIHPISSEFLPTETWTFTLNDGSTVTKKVAIGE